MAIFDTHAHYVKNDFGEALHPLLSSMSEAGVEKIMYLSIIVIINLTLH